MTLRLGARLWWGVPILVLLLWVLGLLVIQSVPGLPTPPAFTGWALPIARFARDVSGMIAVGAVVVGALLAPSVRVRGWALRWVAIWLGLTLVLLALTMVDLFSVLSGTQFDTLTGFLLHSAIGQVFLAQLIGQLVLLALIPFAARRSIAWTASSLGLVAFMLPSLLGHGGLTGEHVGLVVSLALHLGAVALWVGGLAVAVGLLLLEPERASSVLPRFSLLALFSVFIVAESGLLNASLRLLNPGAFVTTTYGSLVLAKIALLGWLIQLGWKQRTRAIPAALRGSIAPVVRFAAIEAVVMGSAVAIAVLLSRIGPGVVTPDLVAFTPLAVLALGLGIPGVIAQLVSLPRPIARLREFPEGPVVLLLVIAALTGMGALTRMLGVQLGAIIGSLLLLAAGWLALSSLVGPRARLGAVLLAVGWPVVSIGAAVFTGVFEWGMLAACIAAAEATVWLTVRSLRQTESVEVVDVARA